ncbi:MAG: ABC transporter substrate-binding protein [Defluviitaleaceae bacterium]|nr:ABC transporter substrate-binding protein [Defluviitaleaceae bacterium]
MKKFLVVVIAISVLALVAFTGCGAEEERGEFQAASSTELTIAVLRNNSLIEDAARRFEENHDGRYTVTLVVYEDFASYAQIINSSLLGGRGEDIISVQNVAWQRLADAGLLTDLNDTMNFQQGRYYQSVLDAFLYNGGRYVIPMNFGINAFRFDDTVSTVPANPNRFALEDVLKFAAIYPDLPLYTTPMGMTPTDFASMFFNLYFDDFVDLANRTADVDNAKFIGILEDVESISERLRWPDIGESLLMWGDMFHSAAMSANGTKDYSPYHIITNSRGEGLVEPRNLMAVNANSPNQELAARFMQFLLSEEVQTSPEMWSTPINKNAHEVVAQATLDAVRAGGFEPEGFDLARNIAIFNAHAANLTLSGTSDPFIRDFVRDEITRFFECEVTAQQAASNLQARLTIYLNE